jgi:DnaJ-class molecular chaperone
MDYYNILGITSDSSQDQIKKAYKQLAIKWHPDKNSNPGASEKFKSIREAYQILFNTNLNSSYSNTNDTDVMSDEELFESLFTPLGNPFRTNSLFSPFFDNHNDTHNIYQNPFSSTNTSYIIQNGKKYETCIQIKHT